MSEKFIKPLLAALEESYADNLGVNQVEGHDLPSRKVALNCLERLFDVLFPGFFFNGHPLDAANRRYHIGDQLCQIIVALSAEGARAMHYDCQQNNCLDCDADGRSRAAVEKFLRALPAIRETLKKDVQAGYNGDPAASSIEEIIICYPAVRAIATHRLAHALFQAEMPLLPRLWSEHAHSLTGIDIHPGAQIAESFFIDHGTGVVIGETCQIGKRVQIYQGVTLGALAPAQAADWRHTKRHPTIGDNVIIYAGATILGGKTVIGSGATIGGNVWLTSSVEPGQKVRRAKRDLVFLKPGEKKAPPPDFSCPAKEICEAEGTIKQAHGKN